MLGVGTGLGGELHKLRFLLRGEMDFHALKISETGLSGNGLILNDMTLWEVSKLIGARALFPAKDVKENFGEVWGKITGILDVHSSELEAMATN